MEGRVRCCGCDRTVFGSRDGGRGRKRGEMVEEVSVEVIACSVIADICYIFGVESFLPPPLSAYRYPHRTCWKAIKHDIEMTFLQIKGPRET